MSLLDEVYLRLEFSPDADGAMPFPHGAMPPFPPPNFNFNVPPPFAFAPQMPPGFMQQQGPVTQRPPAPIPTPGADQSPEKNAFIPTQVGLQLLSFFFGQNVLTRFPHVCYGLWLHSGKLRWS